MDALGVALGDGLVNGGVDGFQRHGVLLGNGVGHQHTAPQTQVLAHPEGLGQLLGRIHPIVHAEAGPAGIEGGQLFGAVADHRHALGFQIFQGQPQVQNGLGAGADHHHRGLGQLFQVGGDVHGGLGSPVHAADAAGGENGDARHVGDHHGGGDGGGAVLAPGAQNRQIPAGGLADGSALLAEVFNFLRGQTGFQPPADDGDGGRNRPVLPDDFLHVQRRFQILGIGHSVGDNGGLQSHHRLAGSQCLRHFRFYIQILFIIHSDRHSFPYMISPSALSVPTRTWQD